MVELSELIRPIVEEIGLKLVAVRILQQGKRRVLNVTIFRSGGKVSLDDCETVSRQVDAALDELQEPILNGPYLLEVESPGLDRELKLESEFDVFRGEPVLLSVRDPIEGLGANFTGELLGLFGDEVRIKNASAVKKASGKGSAKTSPKATAGIEPAALAEVTVPLEAVTTIKLHTDLNFKGSAQNI